MRFASASNDSESAASVCGSSCARPLSDNVIWICAQSWMPPSFWKYFRSTPNALSIPQSSANWRLMLYFNVFVDQNKDFTVLYCLAAFLVCALRASSSSSAALFCSSRSALRPASLNSFTSAACEYFCAIFGSVNTFLSNNVLRSDSSVAYLILYWSFVSLMRACAFSARFIALCTA